MPWLRKKKKWKRPKIKHGKNTKHGYNVFYPANFALGHGADIGWGSFIHAGAGVEVGRGVQVGGGTYIYSVSSIDGKRGRVVIEDNAKIGANSVIMPGVTIGECAVVGAMSFVNKDVPKTGTVMGVPARCYTKEQ